MKKAKALGLGALLLTALITIGCLEQPGSAWKPTQPEEQPVVLIDGTGENQERPERQVPTTAPIATHLTTPLATSPEHKVADERDTRIASPAPAEQVVKQTNPESQIVREGFMSTGEIYLKVYKDQTIIASSTVMSVEEVLAVVQSYRQFDAFNLQVVDNHVSGTPKK